MNQDYRLITDDEIELIEKQTLRVLVQAMQEYSKEARDIFENTPATSKSEIIVLTEDLVQYALEVAELYPINKRFAGFIDYKRVRWLPTSFGMFPQVLLVDAKASTENNRDTLQQSQLPMNAEFISNGQVVTLKAGVPPHMTVNTQSANELIAVTTSAFIHFYYSDIRDASTPPYRRLKAIYALAIPHQRLKDRYNPSPEIGFWGQGKHSTARQEDPRIRVYFTQLKKMCAWRLQSLYFTNDHPYTTPLWRDCDINGQESQTSFDFIGR
ncbi:hypothetical protein DNI29_19430 [Hymenobacter sediminis]|uniref:SfiI family type II restriction endonuclease n=1 Tax=Hymenobacter sediminis TaxID=2218621 RepID=UPI000DA6B76F|nr:SfiI family type II restriction endonuclease [Hymenobacter sediminis]RPD44875.1 hypothetical protein DNI29_19430 [Hymenobacter sediminis]